MTKFTWFRVITQTTLRVIMLRNLAVILKVTVTASSFLCCLYRAAAAGSLLKGVSARLWGWKTLLKCCSWCLQISEHWSFITMQTTPVRSFLLFIFFPSLFFPPSVVVNTSLKLKWGHLSLEGRFQKWTFESDDDNHPQREALTPTSPLPPLPNPGLLHPAQGFPLFASACFHLSSCVKNTRKYILLAGTLTM